MLGISGRQQTTLKLWEKRLAKIINLTEYLFDGTMENSIFG